MADDGNKIIIDISFFLALWENSPSNDKRFNIIDCIENGADVNVKFVNNGNNTPLHIAVIKKNREIVNILLKYGANRNVENKAGKTPLELAKELPECSDIAELLEESGETPVEDQVVTTTNLCKYKRCIQWGHLYESKLLTIIYLRALRSKQIRQFHLATNMDIIGDMDDVCFRYKTANNDNAIFLQARHYRNVVKRRLRVQDLWQPSGSSSLLKYFASYRKIRNKFDPRSGDGLFQGRYEDIKPYYVMYTTLKDDIKSTRKKTVTDDEVIDLIGTGEHQNVFQLVYDEENIDSLTDAILIERIRKMGKKLFQLIQHNNCDIILCDENIRSFHVVLAQKVIKVTEINAEGRRTGSFREEFFSSNEELLIVLRETLYEEAIKANKLSTREIDVSLLRISMQPNPETISELIGSTLVYDSITNTLKLTYEAFRMYTTFQYLRSILSLQIPQSVISEAFQIAGRRKLSSITTFNLPAAFGNLDMTMKTKKTERRLEYLANKISDVINESADVEGNIVIREGAYASDKRLEPRVLAIDGGIAGAVGNLFISDYNHKLKFNLDDDTLGENAKIFLQKLKEKIKGLQRYRFVIESDDFPRLSLRATEHEQRYVKDFLKNLYFYSFQAREGDLDEIGTKELQAHECSDGFSKAESRIKSNELFLKFHNEVKAWWKKGHISHYQTRNLNTSDEIFRDLKNKGFPTFVNLIYLNDMYKKERERKKYFLLGQYKE